MWDTVDRKKEKEEKYIKIKERKTLYRIRPYKYECVITMIQSLPNKNVVNCT